jgi:glycosyltransferase involved in cell wall biosynthesis
MKVLVIAYEALGKGSGTGIVFSNLLTSIPSTDIAQIYGGAAPPSSLACERSFRLSWHQVPMDRIARRVLHWFRKESQVASQTGPVLAPTIEKASKLKRLIRAWADLFPFALDSGFWAWVREVDPDVIFTNMGDMRWMECALNVSERMNIPLVPFFNDDWPSTLYAGSPLTAIPRLFLLRKLRNVLAHSAVGIGASDEMTNEYSRRFGIRFETILPVEESSEVASSPNIKSPGELVELVYVGGLHLKRFESLRVVGSAVAEVRAAGLNCTLKIYCPESDAVAWGKQAVVPGASFIAGSLRYEEISAVLNQADVLVFVESPDKELRRYTRLSFSTKIPQYLAAGRPIFAYGPAEVASCRYISGTGSGFVVEDGSRLTETLRRLIVDPDLRNRLGHCAWTAARQRHTPTEQCERFRQVLTEGAKMSWANGNGQHSPRV